MDAMKDNLENEDCEHEAIILVRYCPGCGKWYRQGEWKEPY